jgi:hypothetical protein
MYPATASAAINRPPMMSGSGPGPEVPGPECLAFANPTSGSAAPPGLEVSGELSGEPVEVVAPGVDVVEEDTGAEVVVDAVPAPPPADAAPPAVAAW